MQGLIYSQLLDLTYVFIYIIIVLFTNIFTKNLKNSHIIFLVDYYDKIKERNVFITHRKKEG